MNLSNYCKRNWHTWTQKYALHVIDPRICCEFQTLSSYFQFKCDHMQWAKANVIIQRI